MRCARNAGHVRKLLCWTRTAHMPSPSPSLQKGGKQQQRRTKATEPWKARAMVAGRGESFRSARVTLATKFMPPSRACPTHTRQHGQHRKEEQAEAAARNARRQEWRVQRSQGRPDRVCEEKAPIGIAGAPSKGPRHMARWSSGGGKGGGAEERNSHARSARSDDRGRCGECASPNPP